jgi:TRAP-type C4-dicarboxylate transport system substrate-binding protein
MPWALSKVVVIAALAGAVITGCGTDAGPGGKVGTPAEPMTVTLADANQGSATPSVMDFVRDVDRDSHGALQINLVRVHNTSSDYEVQIVHGTASGRWNLAWVGTRVLDRVGVPDAGVLQVPFLIDSYALAGAVVNGPIGAQLTAEISHAGVVGVALLADQLRYFATMGRVTSPGSLVGKRIGVFDSASEFAGWRALHATPVLEPGATYMSVQLMHEGRLFGLESDPSIYAGQSGIAGTTYTVGVPIWPRPVAIIAAPRWYASLPASSRAVLRRAARQASAQSLVAAPGVDESGIRSMCSFAVHVHALNPAQRAAFMTTGHTIAVALARTERYGALISKIERLKRSDPPQPAPAIPANCGRRAVTPKPKAAGGSRVARQLAYALRPGTVYRAMIAFALTKQQLGLQQADSNAGTFTWHLSSRNRFSFTQRPQFPALSPPGPPATGTFKIDGDLLYVTLNPPYAGTEIDRCSVSGTSVSCRWLSGDDGWTRAFGIAGMTTPLTLVRG